MLDDILFKAFDAVEKALDDLRQEVRRLAAENMMLKRRPVPMCVDPFVGDGLRNPPEPQQRIERANPEAGEF
jgi:hypothetical protein